MVDGSRFLFEAPLLGFIFFLLPFVPRDPAEGEGEPGEQVPAPAPEPPGAAPAPSVAPLSPGDSAPSDAPASPPDAAGGGGRRGPVSLSAPPVVARALLALLPFVQAILRRCGVAERDVPDVTQDVLIQVLPWWAERAVADPEASPAAARGYVRMTAIRSAMSYRVRDARRGECLGWEPGHSDGRDDDDEDAPPVTAAPPVTCLTPEDLLLEIAAQQAIEADVEALSTATDPASWRAFHAYTAEGLPVNRIAEAEGVPAATIYTRIRLARRDLRAAIQRLRAAKRRP